MTGREEVMSKRELLEIEMVSVKFYSNKDEDDFFAWLQSIPSVVEVEGRGRSLYAFVNEAALSMDDAREFAALFYRYRISLKELAKFGSGPIAAEFNNPKGYWYTDVFGVD